MTACNVRMRPERRQDDFSAGESWSISSSPGIKFFQRKKLPENRCFQGVFACPDKCGKGRREGSEDLPEREDAFDGPDLTEGVFGEGFVQIQDTVGVFALAFIHKVRDIDAVRADGLGNFVDHIGHV